VDINKLVGDVMNAQKQSMAEGADVPGRLGSMRDVWESYPLEVRYAVLAETFARWFAATAPHNHDRLDPIQKMAGQHALLSTVASEIMLSLPEIERAVLHEAGDGVHVDDEGVAHPCDCLSELGLQLKLEGLFVGDGEPPEGQKGEA